MKGSVSKKSDSIPDGQLDQQSDPIDMLSRRHLLRTSASLGTAGIVGVATVAGQQEETFQANNDLVSLGLSPDYISSGRYASSLEFDGENRLKRPFRFSGYTPEEERLNYVETVESTRLSGEGWQGFSLIRTFEFNTETEYRIEQRSLVPPEEPLVLTEMILANTGEESLTIRRPDNHIHNGWVLAVVPPLANPEGTYRYSIDGDSPQSFAESDLWYTHELTDSTHFITQFADRYGITLSYLGGHTDPVQAITDNRGINGSDLEYENKSELPRSEENPPARVTEGFSVDTIDFGVDGLSLDAGKTASYTHSLSIHEGGDEAISRAEELTERASTLSDESPSISALTGEGNDSITGAVFRRFSNPGNSPLLLGLGGMMGAGATYLGYRRLRRDTSRDTSTEDNQESIGRQPTTESQEVSLSVDDYESLEIIETVRESDTVRVQKASPGETQVWVLTLTVEPNETLSASDINHFVDTVQPWSQIKPHPNLLSVVETGEEPVPWAAIEPADHPSLSGYIGQISVDTCSKWLKQICEALHHTSRYGLVYQNLTTDNLLLPDDSNVKLRGLLDEFEARNPWYMAPEEFDNTITEQSLVYRTGLVGYELLTGSLPYGSYPDGDPQTVVQSKECIALSERLESYQTALGDILSEALSPYPEDRHETVLHLRDEVEELRK
ncbi:protein kinase domain protein [Natronomonas moolapensis 8.8.11]|uniref:Protein kinase domain protein n=1 Tax=Natronomonas moolapensis (strain DSM 18674 / CECT 7526 / JCM 14361 / 8.8.11) TaxID=268739 RepID=M1XKX7_NATM8|nr:protein kinase [Natronomonas moolapensis]CCQ36694.1 protein kinase domain protein [Natronomonas moolapensis 8.8.11]